MIHTVSRPLPVHSWRVRLAARAAAPALRVRVWHAARHSIAAAGCLTARTGHAAGESLEGVAGDLRNPRWARLASYCDASQPLVCVTEQVLTADHRMRHGGPVAEACLTVSEVGVGAPGSRRAGSHRRKRELFQQRGNFYSTTMKTLQFTRLRLRGGTRSHNQHSARRAGAPEPWLERHRANGYARRDETDSTRPCRSQSGWSIPSTRVMS